MVKPTIALLEYLRNTGTDLDGDFLREGIALLTHLLMEAEVSEQIGAERYERSDERLDQRNGYRERNWETRVGDIPVRIPKLRRGSYFPSFLEPRRRAERALIAVIQSAYVEGVSTRKVDDLVQALGLAGVDKSKVSRICKELDEAVTAFRNRPLEEAYPYLWLDGLYLKVRQNHRIVNMAVVIAIGVRESGERDILAIDIEHFIPLEVSRRITGQIMRALQNARKAPGQDRIYAGEKEHEQQKLVRERGIPINRNLRRDLQTVRDELGIAGYETYF